MLNEHDTCLSRIVTGAESCARNYETHYNMKNIYQRGSLAFISLTCKNVICILQILPPTGAYPQRLKGKTFVPNYWNILVEPMGSDLMDFTNGLSHSFG